jgi:hypothetical protein
VQLSARSVDPTAENILPEANCTLSVTTRDHH